MTVSQMPDNVEKRKEFCKWSLEKGLKRNCSVC